MAIIFAAPGKYIQGRGELRFLSQHISKLGKKALVIASELGETLRSLYAIWSSSFSYDTSSSIYFAIASARLGYVLCPSNICSIIGCLP